jgi:hypothetical protein
MYCDNWQLTILFHEFIIEFFCESILIMLRITYLLFLDFMLDRGIPQASELKATPCETFSLTYWIWLAYYTYVRMYGLGIQPNPFNVRYSWIVGHHIIRIQCRFLVINSINRMYLKSSYCIVSECVFPPLQVIPIHFMTKRWLKFCPVGYIYSVLVLICSY